MQITVQTPSDFLLKNGERKPSCFSCIILWSLKQHSDTLSIHNSVVSNFSTTVYLSVQAEKRVFKALSLSDLAIFVSEEEAKAR